MAPLYALASKACDAPDCHHRVKQGNRPNECGEEPQAEPGVGNERDGSSVIAATKPFAVRLFSSLRPSQQATTRASSASPARRASTRAVGVSNCGEAAWDGHNLMVSSLTLKGLIAALKRESPGSR